MCHPSFNQPCISFRKPLTLRGIDCFHEKGPTISGRAAYWNDQNLFNCSVSVSGAGLSIPHYLGNSGHLGIIVKRHNETRHAFPPIIRSLKFEIMDAKRFVLFESNLCENQLCACSAFYSETERQKVYFTSSSGTFGSSRCRPIAPIS